MRDPEHLVHDLLHYAAEQEAGVQTGFWGTLASGRTLADMNDRPARRWARTPE